MKTEPKFVPGEKVLIETMDYPQYNGPAVVTEAKFGLMSGKRQGRSHRWAYKTTTIGVDDRFFAESALRKLPPDQSIPWADSVFQPDREKVKP
jgi:hypothetical protein